MGDPVGLALRTSRSLEELGIPYFLGGSFASSVWGEPRSTNDLDFVIELSRDQIPKFVARFAPSFYVDRSAVEEAVAARASFNVIENQSVDKIDFFILTADPFRRSAMARRLRVVVAPPDGVLYVPTAEDCVLQKLDWYEAAGRISDRQWRDVLGILKVQSRALDRAYLTRWSFTLGLSGLLREALRQAGLLAESESRPP